MIVLMPTICLVCSKSKTFDDKGSSSTCFPSFCKSSWCFLDFSCSTRCTCFTTMSIATWFSILRGIMISAHPELASSTSVFVCSMSVTCEVTLRFDVAMKIWFHKRDPLFDTSFYVPSPFSNISGDLFCFSISKQPYNNAPGLSTHFFALDIDQHRPLQISSYPTTPRFADHTVQKCLPRRAHGGNILESSLLFFDGPRRNILVYLRDDFDDVNAQSCHVLYCQTTNPCLRSLKHFTNRSKSMALGESKSYSFLRANFCCSGVETL